jgi:hypothetical protein
MYQVYLSPTTKCTGGIDQNNKSNDPRKIAIGRNETRLIDTKKAIGTPSPMPYQDLLHLNTSQYHRKTDIIEKPRAQKKKRRRDLIQLCVVKMRSGVVKYNMYTSPLFRRLGAPLSKASPNAFAPSGVSEGLHHILHTDHAVVSSMATGRWRRAEGHVAICAMRIRVHILSPTRRKRWADSRPFGTGVTARGWSGAARIDVKRGA